MCSTPAPPSATLVAATTWSGTGEVKTSPAQAASSMPGPTNPPCSGSCPDPPPEISPTLPRTGAAARWTIFCWWSTARSGCAASMPRRASATTSAGSLISFFTAAPRRTIAIVCDRRAHRPDPEGPEMNRLTNRVGIGLAAVARPAYITSGRGTDLGDHRSVDELRQRTWDVLEAAYDSGIRYVDVARSYGRAEEFLAGWLGAHPGADEVRVGSKWGYRYVGGWRRDAEVHEVKDHSLAAFTEQFAETDALLGKRLERYHIHSATPETGVLDDPAVLRALAGLRERGIRVGVSTSGPTQADVVRRAVGIVLDGQPLFGSVQSTWNVLETSAGP